MITETRDHKQIDSQCLNSNDFESLMGYFNGLSNETKRRFGPHLFDQQSVMDFYENGDQNRGFWAIDTKTNDIISYAIIKQGFLVHDQSRLQKYGLKLDNQTDCTFAPSVADMWQGIGVGIAMLHFIISEIQEIGINRIILWGGVQSNNVHAKNHYLKAGFKVLGYFEYHGQNEDMILELKVQATTKKIPMCSSE